MTKMPREVSEILDQLHAEGYKPGTPQFNIVFRKRKVERCQEMHGVRSCGACKYFDYCELAKEHLRDMSEMNRQKANALVEKKENVKP